MTLTSAQSGLRAHSHTISGKGDSVGVAGGSYTAAVVQSGTLTTNQNTAQDASQSHENMPPFYVLTYIIRK